MNSKILNDKYGLEWMYHGKWVSIGEKTSDLTEAKDCRNNLLERAEYEGRSERFRIVRYVEVEVE